MTFLAKVFSILFLPLFMPFFGFAILLYSSNPFSLVLNPSSKLILLGVCFTICCLFPVLNILFMKRLKLINSIQLENKEERTLPYISTILFYIGFAYLLYGNERLPFIFVSFILSGAFTIAITMVVNKYWKISAHMTGIGGLLGSIIALSIAMHFNFIWWICLIIFIAGLTGFARLKLQAHTNSQVYIGFLLGTLSTLIFLSVCWKLKGGYY